MVPICVRVRVFAYAPVFRAFPMSLASALIYVPFETVSVSVNSGAV